MDKKLVSVLSEVFGIPAAKIVPGLTKADVDIWDSLKQMDLVLSLEREFGVALEITDIVQMDSVANIIDVLKKKSVQLES